jgi:hypothetical protein
MWATNFCTTDCKTIYALWPDTSEEAIKECRENNDYSEDVSDDTIAEDINNIYYDYQLDDIKDYIVEDLMELKKISKKIDVMNSDEMVWPRNYEWHNFCDINISYTNYMNVDFWVKIQIIVRNWYHEWCNLDYVFTPLYESYDDFDLETHLNKSSIQVFNRVIKEINKIFNKHSTAYNKVGTFSNWEWVYEKFNF